MVYRYLDVTVTPNGIRESALVVHGTAPIPCLKIRWLQRNVELVLMD